MSEYLTSSNFTPLFSLKDKNAYITSLVHSSALFICFCVFMYIGNFSMKVSSINLFIIAAYFDERYLHYKFKKPNIIYFHKDFIHFVNHSCRQRDELNEEEKTIYLKNAKIYKTCLNIQSKQQLYKLNNFLSIFYIFISVCNFILLVFFKNIYKIFTLNYQRFYDTLLIEDDENIICIYTDKSNYSLLYEYFLNNFNIDITKLDVKIKPFFFHLHLVYKYTKS